MAKFFRIPFGKDGDRTEIPEDAQLDGSVSYDEGFPEDYELDPEDPDVRYPERDKFNELHYEETLAIQQYQTHGFPDFITDSDNAGSPYPYDINAFVRYSDDIYYSLQDANTADPTDPTKWAKFAPFVVPTGTVWDFLGGTLPAGWVWPDGSTIGSATSGATGRANADTVDLFTLLWENYSNTVLPIQTSGGAPSTRGVSASVDFAANKRMPVPDMRGRITIGRDDMGGSAANRITTGGSGISGITLGASGGTETVILTEANLASHTHSNTLAVGSHVLTVSEIPQHTHFTTVDRSISTSAYAAPSNTKSFIRGWNGGGADEQYKLNAFYDDAPTISPTGAPVSSGAATGHTHTLTGSIGNAGSSTAHLNVQPGIVCNKIIKL